MLILKSNTSLRKYFLYAKKIRIFAGVWDPLISNLLEEIHLESIPIDVELIVRERLPVSKRIGSKITVYNPEYLWIDQNILILVDDKILILGIPIPPKANNFKYVVFEDNPGLVANFQTHLLNIKQILAKDKITQNIKQLYILLPQLQKAILRFDCALLPQMEAELNQLAEKTPTLSPITQAILYEWKMRRFLSALKILSKVQHSQLLPLGPVRQNHLDFNYYLHKQHFSKDFLQLLSNIRSELQSRIFYFSNKTKDELKPLLQELVQEKLNTLELQLKMVRDPNIKRKLSQLQEEYQQHLKYLNDEPDEFHRIPDRYFIITFLSEKDRAKMQQIYHNTMKIIHPDRMFGENKILAQNFVKILNQAYKHEDIITIKALHKLAREIQPELHTNIRDKKVEIASLWAAIIFNRNYIIMDLLSPVATANSVNEALEAMKHTIKEELAHTQIQQLLMEFSWKWGDQSDEPTDEDEEED